MFNATRYTHAHTPIVDEDDYYSYDDDDDIVNALFTRTPLQMHWMVTFYTIILLNLCVCVHRMVKSFTRSMHPFWLWIRVAAIVEREKNGNIARTTHMCINVYLPSIRQINICDLGFKLQRHWWARGEPNSCKHHIRICVWKQQLANHNNGEREWGKNERNEMSKERKERKKDREKESNYNRKCYF